MAKQSRLLLSIPSVTASQIYEGERTVIAQGVLNVTLLSQRLDQSIPPENDLYESNQLSTLPISHGSSTDISPDYPPTDLSTSGEAPNWREDDVFLYLAMGQNEFDFPLPAYTRIIPQGESAYLIPSQDVTNAFIQLDLACSSADDRETFEILLSQFTAYEERMHDLSRKDLILIDSSDGHVLGSIPHDNLVVHEDPALARPGHEKDPVFIDLSADSETHKSTLTVSPAPDGYCTKSSIIKAADLISSGIIYSSNTISKGIDSSASWYIKRRPTSELPVNFQPTTLERVRKIHQLSNSAVSLSAKATGFLASAAHSLGTGVRHKFGAEDKPGKKPGLLNKSLIAFETIADSLDASTKQLLSTTANATTSMVRSKYGDQAADISHGIGATVRNVGLVYVDARGVTRKALLKGAAKGMLFKAKVGDTEEVILGGGRVESPNALPAYNSSEGKGFRPTSDISKTDTSSYSSLNHPGVWRSDKEQEKKDL